MTQKKNHDDDPTLASLAGETFAILQHGIDLGIEWGFSKISDAARKAPDAQKKTKTAATKIGRFGQGVLRFVGQAGEAYYKSYSELKKKQ